jgi:cytochrome P450
MTIAAKEIGWWDNLRLLLVVILPGAIWGLFAPRRFGVWLLSSFDAGKYTARFLSALRQKYGCSHLWIRLFPGGRTLLVLEAESIDAVLRSGDNQADPPLKKGALSKFIPDGVIISNGEEWWDRRRFNESVLGFGKRLHPHCEAFAKIASGEIDQLGADGRRELRFTDFQALAQRISHQVLLGAGQVDPAMAEEVEAMVKRSNSFLLPRNESAFSAFYARVESRLSDKPSASCLVGDSARLREEGVARSSTQVPRQIGFWFFVLKDAIELHVARTLVLIAAHPETQQRVRAEISANGSLTPLALDGLQQMEACVREGLRLWTPVPVLLRRAVRPFRLRDEIAIEAGEQILIHTGFYHRDRAVFGTAADAFSPGLLARMPPVYYFSDHRQACAGQFLAMFVIKATLASLLAKFRVELIDPKMEEGRIPYLYDHFGIRLKLSAA